jgi:hypothetical protein
MVLKLVENAQVTADNDRIKRPVIKRRLWLNLTLNTPIMKDATKATKELTALICPTMPTCNPKVSPISIRSRDSSVAGGLRAKRDMNREGIKNFPGSR